MKKNNKLFFLLISLIIIILLTSCNEKIKITDFTITGPQEVEVGKKINLSIAVLPESITEYTVSWKVKDENLAFVNNGEITGKSEGKTFIEVTIDSITKEYAIEVKKVDSKVVSSISIIGSTFLLLGEEMKLEAIIYPETAIYDEIIWESANPLIATVNNGVVKGITTGKTSIKAKVGDVSMDYEIEVKKKVLPIETMFSGVNINTVNPICYEKVEMSLIERNIGMIKDNYNPYDYNQIYVYGVFTSPTSKVIQTPAFWYRDYEIVLDESYGSSSGTQGTASNNPNEPQGLERVVWNSDDYEYRLRFQPSEAGNWNYQIYISIEGNVNQIISGSINIALSDDDYKGIIKVDKTNNRSFVYEDGTSYIPIGENLGWWTTSDRKTYDYDVWMKKSFENNMNITRIWMAPWGFSLHSGKKYNDFTDRLNYAARLDKVIELANKYDIYIMLTLINHGQFSSTVNSTWKDNPYNVINGGILEKPEYFFYNTEAKEAYKNELLYIIGRYGYSDNIMAWELFNEVNWTDNADINSYFVKQWHKEMAQFIEQNDSYNHMITTSYNGETGASYSLEEIDFTNPHNYGYNGKNLNLTLPQTLEKLFNMYNKPILHSEIGINWESGYETYKVDPTGVVLRQQSWAGMMGGGAGGAMNWWWDSWVHPYDLYYQFKGAGSYAKLMNLSGSDYTQLRLESKVELPNSVGILGYKFNDRIYGYVYDKSWSYQNPNTSTLTNITIKIPFTNGNYELNIYNALTGEIIGTSKIIISNNIAMIILPSFSSDIAFIIK